ncbi:MAG: hypothetical protein D6714_19445 [Bacteroidetes bacterium]|nr:MAG: hypothetical protein D6714_19445 [Bacteroidota bacterium]
MAYERAISCIIDDEDRVLQHLIFWAYFYLDLPVSILFDPPDYTMNTLSTWVLLATDLLIVYTNLYMLIPRFLMQTKTRLYIGLTFASVLVGSVFNQYFDLWYNTTYFPEFEYFLVPSDWINTLVFQTSVLGTAVGLHIMKRFLRNQKRLKELEHINLKTELAFLKEQINPHFLFNALNNLYVQTRTRPNEASESVLLLSDLLRYQLYDCAKEKVYLKGELEYLQNYLKLDTIRKGNVRINFQVEGNVNGVMVAPFIFLPFIENAVKHSLSLKEESFINIVFKSFDGEIQMIVENSKGGLPPKSNQNGGIGLHNVKRRLELTYPNAHQLKIEETTDRFRVELRLSVKKTTTPIKTQQHEMHYR